MSDYLRRASAAGFSWPLPEGLDDAALEAALFPALPPVGEEQPSDPTDVRSVSALVFPAYRVVVAGHGVDPAVLSVLIFASKRVRPHFAGADIRPIYMERVGRGTLVA